MTENGALSPAVPPISIRVDKWLWAVRICKTRAMASDLCKRQRVSIEAQQVKPSREIRVGQVITVCQEGVNWQYRVLKCIEKRVGAQVAQGCYADVTPKEEKDKLALIMGGWIPRRAKGEGRPTKKDRRAVDRLLGN